MKPQNAGLVNPFRNISFTFVLGPQVKEAASTEIVPSSMTPAVAVQRFRMSAETALSPVLRTWARFW